MVASDRVLSMGQIELRVKQGDIKYYFLSLLYDSTWDWTRSPGPLANVVGVFFSLSQLGYRNKVLFITHGLSAEKFHEIKKKSFSVFDSTLLELIRTSELIGSWKLIRYSTNKYLIIYVYYPS